MNIETLNLNLVKPIALVHGKPFLEIPNDLYIPPEAMEVFIETFSGPFDLLLYLIKRNNLDILNIPIAEITRQYMKYVDLMKTIDLELAAEYLVMAAMLAEIKSRMLLPKPIIEEEENDPRVELIRRLQEYERFKKAAKDLDQLPRLERDIAVAHAELPETNWEKPLPNVQLQELILAFKEVLQRVASQTNYLIRNEPLSIRERMTIILSHLNEKEFQPFLVFFKASEGRQGVVVTFIAMLELLKENLIEVTQREAFAPIYLRKVNN